MCIWSYLKHSIELHTEHCFLRKKRAETEGNKKNPKNWLRVESWLGAESWELRCDFDCWELNASWCLNECRLRSESWDHYLLRVDWVWDDHTNLQKNIPLFLHCLVESKKSGIFFSLSQNVGMNFTSKSKEHYFSILIHCVHHVVYIVSRSWGKSEPFLAYAKSILTARHKITHWEN